VRQKKLHLCSFCNNLIKLRSSMPIFCKQLPKCICNKIMFKRTRSLSNAICDTHNVTFPVTWPFHSSGDISYRCSIVTECLSPTIFEIMGILYIWVTTLTFLGHVTSSITWPIDLLYRPKFPIGVPLYTEPLSLSVTRYSPSKTRAHTRTHTKTDRRQRSYNLSHAML